MSAQSTCLSSAHGSLAAPRERRTPSLFTALLTKFAEWRERAEQRIHLAHMDDRMLKDIGVSGADAWNEAQKPFWKS